MRITGAEQFNIRAGDKQIQILVYTDKGGDVMVEVDFDDVNPEAAKLVAKAITNRLAHRRG